MLGTRPFRRALSMTPSKLLLENVGKKLPSDLYSEARLMLALLHMASRSRSVSWNDISLCSDQTFGTGPFCRTVSFCCTVSTLCRLRLFTEDCIDRRDASRPDPSKLCSLGMTFCVLLSLEAPTEDSSAPHGNTMLSAGFSSS